MKQKALMLNKFSKIGRIQIEHSTDDGNLFNSEVNNVAKDFWGTLSTLLYNIFCYLDGEIKGTLTPHFSGTNTIISFRIVFSLAQALK